MKDNKDKIKLSFASIDPFVVENKIEPTEKEIKGQGFVSWGTDNSFPNYLYDLYNNVASLRAIINGVVDYVVGDGVKSNIIGLSDEKIEDLVKDIALSYAIYGGFALNILRNKVGGIAEIHCLDFRNVRSSKKGDWLYYSEDFGRKSFGRGKYISYPKFNREERNVPSSILYYKNTKTQAYPSPIHLAAITACEIERDIDEFHLNNLHNGFMGSVLVSLNNGIPSDEAKEEIERGFEEKFGGYKNGGRMVISYADNKDSQATISKIDTEDFSQRYETLAKRSSQQIFTSWRCHPIIMGLPTEGLGFSDEPFDDAFKIFNRTVVMPIQKMIVNTFNKIFDADLTIKIKPFSIDWEDGEDNIEVVK